MKKLISVLMIVVLLISFTCFVISPTAIAESLTPLIKVVSCTVTESSTLVAIFENTGDIVVPDFEAQFLLKDANGNILSTEKDGHDVVLPHSQVVSRISLFGSEYDNIDSVEVLIDADKNTNTYENHAAQLDIKSNIGNDCVIAQITNKSGVKIEELEVVTVFFKGDVVVGAEEQEETQIPDGSLTVMQFSIPYDKQYNRVNYDAYKVYINQAHTW